MEAGGMEIVKPAAERPHILAIPYPFMGHMTPVLQVCKMLIAKAGCRVTIACVERDVPSLRRLLPELHDHIKVLPISEGLPRDLGEATWDTLRDLLFAYQEGLARSFAPHIESFSDVVCLISDVFLSWTQDVANQLGVPRIAVWVSAAAEHQVYFHAKELLKAGKLPFKAPKGTDGRLTDIDSLIPHLKDGSRPPIYHRVDGISEEEEEIKIAGLSGLHRRDFTSFLQLEDSSDPLFYYFIEHIKTASQASMVLFNTFEALEGSVLEALRSQGTPAHPIGPLFLLEEEVLKEQVQVAKEVQNEEYPECLKWLDGQKPKSVVYVAFGTLVQLPSAQVRELALGLLYSGHPFIWVYKPIKNGVEEVLPEEFLGAVKDRGIMLEWAPQKRILSHPATGGFLSHCGWNSTMESICSGVPTLGLPYFSDQPLHCKLMVDDWKVGLRLEKSLDGGVAPADHIAQRIQELLQLRGGELRKRAQELKLAAQNSIQPGGCSRRTLDTIIKLIINNK